MQYKKLWTEEYQGGTYLKIMRNDMKNNKRNCAINHYAVHAVSLLSEMRSVKTRMLQSDGLYKEAW